MPTVTANGVTLYYEEAGQGPALVFVHEFAGDMRAWEPQLRFFSRRYRVIVYNQRGYPPSEVPPDQAAYSHDALIGDLLGLIDALGIERVHVAGLATGGNVALNFGIRYPDRARSLVVAGAGAGTVDRENWLKGAGAFADAIERSGTAGIVANIEHAPQRVIYRAKDPRGWGEFLRGMGDFSPVGCAHLMRNALMNRTPVFDLEEEVKALRPPTLVMVGDQDEPAFEASRFLCKHAPNAGMVVLPMCGHTLNSEEPDWFNRHVADFLAAVDAGKWGTWTACRRQRDRAAD